MRNYRLKFDRGLWQVLARNAAGRFVPHRSFAIEADARAYAAKWDTFINEGG